MKKRAFEKFITTSIDKGKKEKVIYSCGLDLINFMDDYAIINNILLTSIYGEECSDIILDFIFDKIYNELEFEPSKYSIYDKDDNIIADCSTLDGLYDYVEKTRLELISTGYSYDIKEPMSEEERMNIIKELFI
jgi:hypothetical protein